MDSAQNTTQTGGGLFASFRKRTYRVGRFVNDVGDLIPELVDVGRIWLGGRIDPAFREEIMVAVARINHCRYCSFAHHEWALHAGLPAEELARVEGMDPGDFDPARWVAVQYARAYTLGETATLSPDLTAKLREHNSDEQIADIERVVKVMTVMNLSGNTVDALLSRLRGEPAEDSGLLDELFITALFMGVAPFVAIMLAVWRRQSPPALLRDFQEFSRELEQSA